MPDWVSFLTLLENSKQTYRTGLTVSIHNYAGCKLVNLLTHPNWSWVWTYKAVILSLSWCFSGTHSSLWGCKMAAVFKTQQFRLPVNIKQTGAASHANTCYLIGGIKSSSTPKKWVLPRSTESSQSLKNPVSYDMMMQFVILFGWADIDWLMT